MPTKPTTRHLELIKTTGGKKSSSPGVLLHIEEQTLKASRQLIDHMFCATDDLFYELSKRATSNNEQDLYFESMREIRIKKEAVIDAFLQGLTRSFEHLLQPQEAGGRAHHNNDGRTKLSLVEGDDLEVELALKGMANRAENAYKTDIYELSTRLDHLLLQIDVDDDNNPLSPLHVSKAFVQACLKKLTISIKTRLILFKLFDKHVLKQLGHIYADANQTLIETGVLPKIPPQMSHSTRATNHPREKEGCLQAPAASRSPPTAPPAQASNAIVLTPEALAALMVAIRNAGVTAGKPYTAYGNNPGPILAAHDIASSLTSQQSLVDDSMAHSAPKVVLRDIVDELLVKSNPATPNCLAQTEEDTINVVAMFFDKVLEDPDLPTALQSLVCRLQIPILKAALKNPAFLSDDNHPARKLVNAIVRAGLTFDSRRPLERDPLYRAIADGIHTINRQYVIDDGIFSIVESTIDELIQTESRKSLIVEQRTAQAETGKAKIRDAKAFAQLTLFAALKTEHLPNSISEFFTNTWLHVLIITFIKEGKESAVWVENEQLISDLIWLSKPHQDQRSKARAQRLKPEILKRIEKGLALAIDNVETRHARILAIEGTITAIIDNEKPNTIDFRALDPAQMQALDRTCDKEKSWAEMTALEEQPESEHQELSSRFYLKAKNIAEGTWVQYQEENKPFNRCKLSKKVDPDTYIFVNRFGLKVLEKSRRQFAYDMQCNNVKAINETPIFDRIMTRILSHFQDLRV